METVNAMAAAAAKAVWGDSTTAKEPVSGKTGNTSAGEPYDAGNMDQANTTTTSASTTGTSTTDTSTIPAAKTSGTGSGITSGSGSDSTDPVTSAVGDAEFANNTGTATTADDTPENPSTNQKLKDADASKGQQDTRDPEEPLTNPKSAPTEVNDRDTNDPEDGVNEEMKLDGPGPRPLEEVAREHGGDAGNIHERKGSLVPPRDPNDTSEAPKSDAEKQEDKGDGTLYVKSSGLKADGGDFDATKPGAGREADRLMEAKGMHPNADATENASSSPVTEHHTEAETKEKKKLTQRIKEKLHSH